MGYAFLSYSTKDQTEADTLREILIKNNIPVWMAPNDIPPGSRYAQVINQAIKNCTCFILLLSRDAQSSTWVGKEVERAVNYRKTIIPLQLDDAPLNDEFEFYISTDQIFRVYDMDESNLELQSVIRSLAYVKEDTPENTDGPDIPLPKPQKEREKQKKKASGMSTKAKIILLVFAAIVVCGILFLILGVALFLFGWLNGYIDL